MAKRTHTLKSIAARHTFFNDVDEPIENSIEQASLDPIDDSCSSTASTNPPQVTDTWHNLLTSELSKAAQLLELRPAELQLWLEPYRIIPGPVLLSLLRLITSYGLDPLLEEVCFVQHEKGQWQASITVNGWSKMINKCSAFAGVHFCQSIEESEDQIPLWMECTIYRIDRNIPITVREYFSEVRRNTEIWKKMPRRMLRHRTFAQCARLAFSL